MEYVFLLFPIALLLMGYFYISVENEKIAWGKSKKNLVMSAYTAVFTLFLLYLYQKWGITEVFVRHFIVLMLFYISLLTDIRTMELPIEYYLSFILPAVLIFTMGSSEQKYWELLYLVITAIVLFSVSYFSKNAFGFGDSLFIVIITCFLGFYLSVSLFLVALCVAGIGSLVLLVLQKVGRKTQMPFVPFLLSAYIFHLLII